MIFNKVSRLAVAPMMGYTDFHFLKLLNILSAEIDLYSEMFVADAFIRLDSFAVKSRFGINGRLVLQLGGSDPVLLQDCAYKALGMGFDAVNLNVGCPSSRVVRGNIGAVLMRSPDVVSECLSKMSDVITCSLKTRVGVDDDPDNLDELILSCIAAGCSEYIVHARRAWLKGLNPKQNRSVPPLDYDRVVCLKQKFSGVKFLINGEINTLDKYLGLSSLLDGFMIGRMFYSNPFEVVSIAKDVGLIKHFSDLSSVVFSYLDFLDQLAGVSALRHLNCLFRGFPGSRLVRSRVSAMIQSKKIDKAYLISVANHLAQSREGVEG